MQEWDPEHFTSFEHLCEVTLAAVRKKPKLNRSTCGCGRESQLYSFQLEQGLVCLTADAFATLQLPIVFIEYALDKGQLVVEQLAHHDIWETVEPQTTSLRACFPPSATRGWRQWSIWRPAVVSIVSPVASNRAFSC